MEESKRVGFETNKKEGVAIKTRSAKISFCFAIIKFIKSMPEELKNFQSEFKYHDSSIAEDKNCTLLQGFLRCLRVKRDLCWRKKIENFSVDVAGNQFRLFVSLTLKPEKCQKMVQIAPGNVSGLPT